MDIPPLKEKLGGSSQASANGATENSDPGTHFKWKKDPSAKRRRGTKEWGTGGAQAERTGPDKQRWFGHISRAARPSSVREADLSFTEGNRRGRGTHDNLRFHFLFLLLLFYRLNRVQYTRFKEGLKLETVWLLK